MTRIGETTKTVISVPGYPDVRAVPKPTRKPDEVREPEPAKVR